MSTELAYSVVLVSGRLTVAVRELSATEDERELELRVNGKVRGQVCLRPWCMPRLAIGDGELLLWGGLRAFVLAIGGGPILRFDIEDEIHGAYRFPNFWCLVCETSVVLWTSAEGVSLAECHHDEVLLGSWWQEGHLVVEDLRGRYYAVEIDETDLHIALCPWRGEESATALGSVQQDRK